MTDCKRCKKYICEQNVNPCKSCNSIAGSDCENAIKKYCTNCDEHNCEECNKDFHKGCEVVEISCVLCHRKNDKGIKTCWYCGNDPEGN